MLLRLQSRGTPIEMNQFPPLQASHLNHRYGSVQVLTPLDITLKSGEIAILEGPNGSGKSTLLLCLSGLLRPTSGEVWVDGHNLAIEEPAAKRCLAFVPDVARVYLELTAWEHLHFIALANQACVDFEERAEALLRTLGLWDARNLFPHHFSRGMRLKLGLAMTFIRPFNVLLLAAAAGGGVLRGALAGVASGFSPTGLRGASAGALLPTAALLIPETAAAVAGMAALDVMRHAQSALLLNGQAPDVGFLGVLSGLIAVGLSGIPLALLPGIAWLGVAVGVSLLAGIAAGRTRPTGLTT